MRYALLLALLLTSCASNDGFEGDASVGRCDESSEIEIRAGIGRTSSNMPQTQGRFTVLVNVANNSDEAVTVDFVRIEPAPMDANQQYEIAGGSRDEDQRIDEAAESTFEVELTTMVRESRMRGRSGDVSPFPFDATVVVGLKGGDVYRCRFRLP